MHIRPTHGSGVVDARYQRRRSRERGVLCLSAAPMLSGARRRGFTLVELSVVIAVLGAASALLLPAVQAARETARRNQCVDHLRYIGLGVQKHLASKEYFPTAGANGDALEHFRDRAATNVVDWMGWPFQLLPYIGEETLYGTARSHFDQRGTPYNRLPGTRQALVEIPINLYWCPTRGVRLSKPAVDGRTYALIDYAGLSQGQMGRQHALSFNYNFVTGALMKVRGWRGIIAKGGHYDGTAWRSWGTVKARDVTDGLSNTIAVIEKAVYVNQYQPISNANLNWAEIPGWAHGAHQTTMRMATRDAALKELGIYPGPLGPMSDTDVAAPNYARDGFTDRPLTVAADQSPGSPHRAMHALYGDGSVRSVSLSIDNTDGVVGGSVFFKLSVRDDGSSLNGSELGSIEPGLLAEPASP